MIAAANIFCISERLFHRLIGDDDDELARMCNPKLCVMNAIAMPNMLKLKINFSLLISSFLQIPSTMKEDEIDAGDSRGVERFVTHVDLNQAGTLLVSLAHAERESAPHIKCDFELFFLSLACCQK